MLNMDQIAISKGLSFHCCYGQTQPALHNLEMLSCGLWQPIEIRPLKTFIVCLASSYHLYS
jgi:hypothetical protein